ncbi:MAG: hypothetical protein II926_02460 [Bacteroidales bacterium]|nr:hypothetical protein [Bacteroidales bacterium]
MRKIFLLSAAAFLSLSTVFCYPLNGNQPTLGYNNNLNFRLAIDGGMGFRLAEAAEPVDYTRHLKRGFVGNIDASYFISDTWGIGAMGNIFKTSYSQGSLSDNIAFWFIGPTLSERAIIYSRKTRAPQCAVYANTSLGLISYKDKGSFLDENNITTYATVTGKTFGVGFSIDFDYYINENFTVGVQARTVLGSLSKVVYSLATGTYEVTLPDDQQESLSHLDIGLGVRWNL